MPRLIPPRYTPAKAAQRVGAPERLCGGQTVIRINLLRQNTNNAARRRRHLGRATCEVTGLRFEAQGPAPIYKLLTLLWLHGHGGGRFEVYDDVSPTGRPGGLAMTGRVRSWARLVKGKPNFTRKSQPAPDFTPDERQVIAQAAGKVVDFDGTRPASGLSGAVCATSPSDGPEYHQDEDGASTRVSTAHGGLVIAAAPTAKL